MEKIPMPVVQHSGSDVVQEALDLMDIMNVCNLAFNADTVSHERGLEGDDRMDVAVDFSMCGLSNAAAHVCMEAQSHIADHDGYNCAERIIDVYAVIFKKMCAAIMKQALEGDPDSPFNTVDFANKEVYDDIMSKILKGEKGGQ
jgi:hypothetical protein